VVKMDKLKWKKKFKDKFTELKKDFELLLFRNPKEFIHFNLEFVNPTHKVNIYGIPKKKYRRDNYVKQYLIGKIFFKSFMPIFYICMINDFLLKMFYYSVISYLFFCLIVFICDNEKVDIDAYRYRGRVGWWKNSLNGILSYS